MMDETVQPYNELIHALKERAKELNCLYNVQELLSQSGQPLDEIGRGLIEVLPPGWQYPDICQVKVDCGGVTIQSPGFEETPWVQSADIRVQEETVGQISVSYKQERPFKDEGPFLKEERKLIDTIAQQIGFYILHQQLRQVFEEEQKTEEDHKNEWQVILDLLKRTDPRLLMRITHKMVYYMIWHQVPGAELLIDRLWPESREANTFQNTNRPSQPGMMKPILDLTDQVFTMASSSIPRGEILENIQKWIKEDRSSFLINTLVNPGSSLAEISAAVERYTYLSTQGIELTAPRASWFRVALIRRILSDHPKFVNIAKNFIQVDDFCEFIHHVIYPLGSHGKLGGKSSGLFLAEQVLKRSPKADQSIQNIKIPKTWYLTSDSVFYFLGLNNLEDIVEQKYKNVQQIRQEYPYIVHMFKNSPLPPEIIKGLSSVLEECRDIPLIVRSSSLLEDQSGQSFAGKYKSLFIANVGTKEERLAALVDAVKEVFASMFAPDPLEYRVEHGLVDYHEEMGILIQEVVGTKVGHYYFPAFAGVAFSCNEYRWSSRIRRQDGLVRIVPGLGTRAVDRLSDDYPVLVSPGQPGLRVNVTPEAVACYSPKKVDVINLDNRQFETIEIHALLKAFGRDYPLIQHIFSMLSGGYLYQYQHNTWGMSFEKGDFLVTFEGLLTRTPFLKQVKTILSILQEAFAQPVDIEFAHDGKDLYLLQCRPQSYGRESAPAEIPRNVPPEKILFSANRYITNCHLAGISHIVYVDPQKYSELSDHQELLAIGRAVGRLNQILPKGRFILMGPGRWGSRGDIKLGVNVTYSDISNTAMLIEIARKQANYVPDVSFGTHFFQDLVEASIRYLPLYPDDRGVIFNEEFFRDQPNLLASLLPEYADLHDVVRVIDVTAVNGETLQVFMNADLEEALGMLGPSKK